LGDLVESRSEEYLLHPDHDILAIRRKMADAFLSQIDGKRPVPDKNALLYPV
jgi:hypothetical protein